MKTVSSLLDDHWYQRYKRISKLNIRSSIYDVTTAATCAARDAFSSPQANTKPLPKKTTWTNGKPLWTRRPGGG